MKKLVQFNYMLVGSENDAGTRQLSRRTLKVVTETKTRLQTHVKTFQKKYLLRVQSHLMNHVTNATPVVSYYITCLPEDEPKAKELLINHVEEHARNLILGARNLQRALNENSLKNVNWKDV